jgi:hypothetical protein
VRSFSHKVGAIDVLRKFGMRDCKSMATLMISNQKKLHDQATGSDLEDPIVYCHILLGP